MNPLIIHAIAIGITFVIATQGVFSGYGSFLLEVSAFYIVLSIIDLVLGCFFMRKQQKWIVYLSRPLFSRASLWMGAVGFEVFVNPFVKGFLLELLVCGGIVLVLELGGFLYHQAIRQTLIQ